MQKYDTLNYTSCYTLHHKFFEYTFCTINYDPYYTLHHDVKFAVNLDAKIWHHIKRPNCLSSHCLKNDKNKLYFTTLKYTLYYTLHPKFFECTFCTINYESYFTLHPNIKFAVNLDKKKWHYMKKPNCLSSQCLKNKK